MADDNHTAQHADLQQSAPFPSVTGVPTAVTAFTGYTERAEINGRSVAGTAVPVASMEEYREIFGGPPSRRYTLAPTAAGGDAGNDITVIDSATGTVRSFTVAPPAAPGSYLYDSMRLYFANGGGRCYVASAGQYAGNGTVRADDLLAGLAAVGDAVGPTIVAVPDAMLLPDVGTFARVAQAMIAQAAALGDRVAILDVFGALDVHDDASLTDAADAFRAAVGDAGLDYGIAYFPYLDTTVTEPQEITYGDLALDDAATLTTLKGMLTLDCTANMGARSATIQATIDAIGPGDTPAEITERSAELAAALTSFARMQDAIAAGINLLPATGAIAGTYCLNDATRNVWNAPADLPPAAVASPSFLVSDAQQGPLNVPIDGKAINVIRKFVGQGTVAWGARTMDGNSDDWRYIQVRRTIIYIEQSIKDALSRFVFAANDGPTWATAVSMVSNFLTGVWQGGGLLGATASEAYTVQCGLGSTMTAQDILDGYMVVQVTLQMIRPAEFIELTFKQEMQGA